MNTNHPGNEKGFWGLGLLSALVPTSAPEAAQTDKRGLSPKAMTSSHLFSQIIFSVRYPLSLFPEVCPELSSGNFFPQACGSILNPHSYAL